MNRAFWLFGVSTVVGIILFFIVVPVEAKKTIGDALGQLNQTVEPTGLDTNSDFPSTVGMFIQMALSVVGITFFGLMLYGGFRWLTSRGEEGVIETAKKTITASIIGICVIVAAFAMTTFITDRLISGGGEDVNPDVIGSGPGAGALGCCVDKVGGTNSLGVDTGVWACSIKTDQQCEQDAITPIPGDDLIGPQYWKWYANKEWTGCVAICDEANTAPVDGTAAELPSF